MLQFLEDWRTKRRRLAKRLGAFSNAQIVFISPAKSGRTWVRAMVSYAYHLSYGTPQDRIVDRDLFHAIDARIPTFFFTHVTNEPAKVARAITAEAMRGKTVVGLLRDPRDVAVSRFHHFSHRSKGNSRKSAAAVADAESPLFAFLTSSTHGLRFVIDRMNDLKALADAHPKATLSHYEDFKMAPKAELARLLEVLGTEVPAEHIAAAVEFTRFENLKKREAQGFYQTDILRAADPGEPNAFKVRRGEVAGYLEDLTPAQVAELDRIVDEQLAPEIGYRTGERLSRERSGLAG